jgi:hypothetical protein
MTKASIVISMRFVAVMPGRWLLQPGSNDQNFLRHGNEALSSGSRAIFQITLKANLFPSLSLSSKGVLFRA